MSSKILLKLPQFLKPGKNFNAKRKLLCGKMRLSFTDFKSVKDGAYRNNLDEFISLNKEKNLITNLSPLLYELSNEFYSSILPEMQSTNVGYLDIRDSLTGLNLVNKNGLLDAIKLDYLSMIWPSKLLPFSGFYSARSQNQMQIDQLKYIANLITEAINHKRKDFILCSPRISKLLSFSDNFTTSRHDSDFKCLFGYGYLGDIKILTDSSFDEYRNWRNGSYDNRIILLSEGLYDQNPAEFILEDDCITLAIQVSYSFDSCVLRLVESNNSDSYSDFICYNRDSKISDITNEI